MKLGEFNDETFKYQILDGLTVEDYIAFPGEDCVEGAPVTRNAEDLYDKDDDSMDGDFGGEDLGGEDDGLTDLDDLGSDGEFYENGGSDEEDFEDGGFGEEVYE